MLFHILLIALCGALTDSLWILTDLSDKEVQDFQEKGELMVAGHLLSGTDMKVKKNNLTVVEINRFTN